MVGDAGRYSIFNEWQRHGIILLLHNAGSFFIGLLGTILQYYGHVKVNPWRLPKGAQLYITTLIFYIFYPDEPTMKARGHESKNGEIHPASQNFSVIGNGTAGFA
jgi:hypothetical protein